MTRKPPEFQPGAMLHEVIVGTFRARSTTLDGWCKDNGVTPGIARNATFGQSRGPGGSALLERIIDAAGREFVRDAYTRRMNEHLSQLNQGAA